MKRDATGKFVSNWVSEAKQRVSLSLTQTAWRSLQQEAQHQGISRSEVIEIFARSLSHESAASRELTPSNLSEQIAAQEQLIATLQQRNQELEALLAQAPTAIAPPFSQQTDRKIALILESITDAFVAFDRDWRYTYVNQAAARLLHKQPEDLLGKHVWHEVFPELVGSLGYVELHRAIAEQTPVAWEEWGPAVEGWLEVNAYPSSEGVAVYFRDVTERKQTEILQQQQAEILQNQQKWLETLLNLLPTPMVFVEPETAKITFANRIADELAGGEFPKPKSLAEYADAYYCTTTEGDRITTDQMPAVLVAQGERLKNYEILWHTPGGSRSLLCWGEIFPAMYGHAPVGIVMFQDVTQLKDAETALQVAKAQVTNILESITDAFFALDHEWRFTYVNQRFEEMCHLSEADLVGQCLWELFPQAAESLFYDEYHRAVAEQVSVVVEAPGPDGSGRWYEAYGYPSNHGLAVYFRDVTERKHLEIDRQRLLEQEQEARLAIEQLLAELRRKDQQQQFLIDLNDAIRAIQESQEILWQVLCNTGQYFDVSRCIYGDIDSTQAEIVINRDYCQGVTSITGKYPLDLLGPAILDELQQRKTVVIHDIHQDPRTAGERATTWQAMQTQSLLCVPLVKAGKFIAVLALHHVTPRQWTQNEIKVMERIADKTCLAVERSRAEEQLREREAHLQLTLKAGRMGTWDWDMQTGKLVWSEGHFTVLGLQPYECEPNYQIWASRVYPEDLAEVEAKMQQALHERTEYHHEYRLRWVDGSIHWVEARGLFICDAQGTPRHFIGAVVEITERKQIEQEREQLLERERNARAQAETAQRQLKKIFETSPVGLALLDSDQRFIALNEALAEINGLTREQHLGRSIAELFGASDPHLVEIFHEIYTTGRSFKAPNFAVNTPGRSDRQPGYYNVDYLPTIDAEGRVSSVLVYVVDVTEQVQLEQAQRFLAEAGAVLASSLDYQTTLEQVAHLAVPQLADWCTVHIVIEDGSIEQIAVAHIDPSKLEWAHQIREKYPLDPDAPRGTALTLRTGKSDFIPDIPDALLVETALDAEHLEILRQVGFKSVMTVPLRTQAQVVGVISLISADSGRQYTLTDLRLAEELAWRASLAIENAQLYRAAQRDRATSEAARKAAESANRIKDEFLAVLSHELRSPLNPILGWAKMLRTKRLDASKTDQALETIERNARLQAQLIEDLLDVSRILQGKMTLNVAPVNLATTIEAALETVRLAAEAKAIQMTTTVQPIMGIVFGDANRLQQVVWNLLSNAVKFTPAGGQINIQLTQVRDQAQIQIKDTGRGIKPDFLPHVFDYFRQEDGTMTRQFGGLGLGLAIVRHLTELHGGTVAVESAGQNLGSTFTVQLPCIHPEATHPDTEENRQTSQPSINSAPLAGLRILVVDDEPDMRELAAFILMQAGAEVTTVGSAAQALASLHESIPDLLLCDIGMPSMDGYALIQQVRKWPPAQGGNLPAIALTAYAGEINQQQALAAGFQKHISKPVEPEELIKAIADLSQPMINT